MRLYDTPQQQYRPFEPGPLVNIYVCGITPYDSAHLGHIFTFMTYDLLQRRLEDLGHQVRLVRNITDVDEPIYRKAAELGISYVNLAEAETASFQMVLRDLRFRPAFAEPKASTYINDMAAAVQALLDTGYGYYVGEDIYFDTAKVQDFGAFSGFSNRLQLGLMAARGSDPERPGKRQALDFLLWRSISDLDDPAQWQTVLGSGRPGWHIECTIMSANLLTVPFDLHGGGSDLILPHHDAEVAQSQALHGVNPAKHWLHVSPLLLSGEKMSKSLGNLVFAKDLLQDYGAAAIRLALMHYHHRVGGEWLPELVSEAAALLEQVRRAAEHCTLKAADELAATIRAALDNDINTPRIVRALQEFCDLPPASVRGSGSPIVTATLALLGLQ